MIKNLSDVELTREFVSHVVAFSMAECGAMGNPGRILILTDKQELFETNYQNEIMIKKCFKVFKVFQRCTNHLKEGSEIPKGWKYTYMGAGNHLFMMDWVDSLFFKIIDKETLESEIYIRWIEVVNQILMKIASKKNYEKLRDVRRKDLKIVPFNAKRKSVGNECIRESLSAKWDSGFQRDEKIVAIGINPSTAQDGESDVTMTRLCRFLDMYGFNNVTMLNLFESVSPDQKKINEGSKTNFNKKREILEAADTILLVWGIEGHKEVKEEAMSVLIGYADKLYCIKNPKGKYPVHPSRMPYRSEIIPMMSLGNFVHVR